MATLKGVRRVKLQFDEKGNPAYESVTSPECFKIPAGVKLLPHDVIPVIFVPGVMGSNLRSTEDKKPVWRPPNGKWEGIKAAWQGSKQKPAKRQRLYDPAKTEVDDSGPCSIPETNFWLTEEEAKHRGWGTVHQGSYHAFLACLEETLNERRTESGHLMNDLLLTQSLGEKIQDVYRYSPKPEIIAKVAAADTMAKWQTPSPPPPLTEEDIKRLGSYYFPVWVHGYNWLRDNAEAAGKLQETIDKAVNFYRGSTYFNCVGKVILVTHSMGGLVARCFAQQHPDQVIGVVHGALPVVGAAATYWRFRAGMESGGAFDIEGNLGAIVIGESANEITPPLACAPGPLELAPTKDYPKGWLQCASEPPFMGQGESKAKVLFSLPKEDPYTEIYSKTTDDCWWAMVDPARIDPAGTIRDNGGKPIKEYKDAIDTARVFHDKLGLYAHPETYGFYGIDNRSYRSFGHVEWRGTFGSAENPPEDLITRKGYANYKYGRVEIAEKEQPPYKPVVRVLTLAPDRNQAGDGTVPQASGEVLRRLQNIAGQDRVFGIEGFSHQGAYDNVFARRAAIYFLIRIVRNAPPPSPPRKGAEQCSK
ncbi:MAG: alpha/beta hydrolase [Betaproteobacteria bacterium]|nr:alpha/beta hydrolase [Betaproteobacteria bacterium]